MGTNGPNEPIRLVCERERGIYIEYKRLRLTPVIDLLSVHTRVCACFLC